MIWTTRIAEQSDKSAIEALFLEMLRSIYGTEAAKAGISCVRIVNLLKIHRIYRLFPWKLPC